ncbi:MAG: glycosyltransferase N-terminal domain-containing protein [Bacteroidota bacterium]
MFFYNLGIHLFKLALKLASPFNTKAKLWTEGRRGWRSNLKDAVAKNGLEHSIWLHCASLGEFEQGRPVIEKIKKDFPDHKVVLTFFSPSGYEIQKNYPLADLVIYLPSDTPFNAKQFLSILQPKIAIFVKYEFWLNYLFELHKRSVPTFLISTVIKKHQTFFKWYGGNFRKALQTYHTIFTQDVYSLRLLKLLKVESGSLAGDTRFDRVLQIGSSPKSIPEIEQFSKNSFVVVAGSSWQKDEEYLIESYSVLKEKNPSLKLIIAPHEIDKNNIDQLKNLLYKYKIPFHLFSDNLTTYTHSVLIVNAIGFLSSVYQYGTLAVIGGGFNNGIHNILEPTVYGLPVMFGPSFEKFNEAYELIDLKAAFVFADSKDLTNHLHNFISDPQELATASVLAKNYVLKNSGATDKIATVLEKYLQ